MDESEQSAVVREATGLLLIYSIVVLVVVLGLYWAIWSDLPKADYLGAASAAGGLLAVGHGIRHHGRRKPSARTSGSPRS